MKKELTCIICPRGCLLTAREENGTITVTGNSCPRGERYAVDELTHPTRTITTTLRLQNRRDTMVSVKTETPVAKEHIFDLMAEIRAVSARAPVHTGDVMLESRYGVRVVATADAE